MGERERIDEGDGLAPPCKYVWRCTGGWRCGVQNLVLYILELGKYFTSFPFSRGLLRDKGVLAVYMVYVTDAKKIMFFFLKRCFTSVIQYERTTQSVYIHPLYIRNYLTVGYNQLIRGIINNSGSSS